jgi:hypothetical protein
MPINPDVYKSLLSELSKINRTVLPDPFYGQLNVPNGRARAMIHEAMVQSEIEMRLAMEAEERALHEHSASSLSTDGGGPKAVSSGPTLPSLLTGLVSYWNFSSQSTISSGTYAGQFGYADATATGNTLVDAADPQDLFNQFGDSSSAYHSSGGKNGGYVDIVNNPYTGGLYSTLLFAKNPISFNNQGSYSFSFWVNKDVDPAINSLEGWLMGIGAGGVSSPSNTYFGIQINSGKVVVYPNGSAGIVQNTYKDVSSAGWHNIIVSVSSGVLTTYVDGVSLSPFTISTPRGGVSCYFSLAPQISVYASNFYGSVDEVGYWSRALTPTEAGTLYNNGTGKFYPFA